MLRSFLLTLLTTLSLTAATFNVSTTPELRTALETAATNGEDDTIVLADGTYKTTDDGGGTFIYYGVDSTLLTITGDSSIKTILSGANQNRVFDLSDSSSQQITLKRLKMVNGYTTENGGAINTTTDLKISNAIFMDNYAGNDAGAIYSRWKGLFVENSYFYNNHATWSAGAILIWPDTNTLGFSFDSYSYIVNSVFEKNKSYLYGVVNTQGTSLNSILNNLFIDNVQTAPILGGTCSLSYNFILQNNIFKGNNATTDISTESSSSTDKIYIRNNYLDENRIDLVELGMGVISYYLVDNNQFNTIDFVDSANKDFRLKSTSSLINAGISSLPSYSSYLYDPSSPVIDKLNNNRVIDNIVDIGPYEFGADYPEITTISSLLILEKLKNSITPEEFNLSVENSLEQGKTYVQTNPSEFSLVTQTASDTAVSSATTTGVATGKQYVKDNLTEFSLVTLANMEQAISDTNSTAISMGENNVKSSPSDYGLFTNSDVNNSLAIGIDTGKEYVQNNLAEYSLVSIPTIEVTPSSIETLDTGWTLSSTPFEITDLSVFDSVNLVWIYNSVTNSWSAYSSDADTMSAINASSSIGTITTIPAGSGIWVLK